MTMENKNLMVLFLTVVSILSVIATVSAADITSVTGFKVKVDGITYDNSTPISVVAGDFIPVTVYFTATQNDTDVTVEAEIEGEKVDTDAVTSVFDVESGNSYRKTLKIEVPYELKDDLSYDAELTITIDGKVYKSTLTSLGLNNVKLNIQRPSYNVDIKSISVSNNVKAGETFPVDVVLKNIGYNDLDDLYVTVSVPELGLEKSAYFGDIVAIEACVVGCDDDEDTVSGRMYLIVPYEAQEGIYAVEVEVSNDDMTSNAAKEIAVSNDFSNGNVIANGNELVIVNPTDSLKVYNVVPVASEDLTISVSDSVVVIPAGSSAVVSVTADSESEGTYTYSVNVLSGNTIVGTANLSKTVEGNSVTNPITVLTIILVIIFVVLLIVLIVLLGKKPEKSEEFGESYY